MGKKSKTKKLARKIQKKKQVDQLEEMSIEYRKLKEKIDELPGTMWVKRRLLVEEQIQIFEQSKDAFFSQNMCNSYLDRIGDLYSDLFSILFHSQNYSEALDVCRKMLQFSSKVINKSLLAPHVDLLLLRVDKSKHDLHSNVIVKVIEVLNEAIANNNVDERFITSQNTYITKCFFELSRLQMYEAVNCLSEMMILANQRIKRNFPTDEGSNFFLFSMIDELRLDILDHGAKKHDTFEIARDNCNSMLSSKCDPLPFGEAFLGSAILGYYATFYEKCFPLEVEAHCIEAMIKYLDFKIIQFSNSCCTCHEVDEDRLMICQGCRAMKFCSKDHQRLNYLHHEETGTKGLGHKYLCPVFKAYHKKMKYIDASKNIDASKLYLLDRKFRRACKRFLIGTLQSVGKKRVKCLVTFKTRE